MNELCYFFREVSWAAPAAAAVIGCCVGSFLNVCIWRMPRNESVVFAPSHCPKCGNNIKFYDNIPIISYIVLGGRCRNCKEPISPRYWLVELLTGVLSWGIYMLITKTAGGTPAFAITLLAALPMVIAGAFIDVEHGIIPNRLTIPTAIAGIALAAAFPANWATVGSDTGTMRLFAALHSAGWTIGTYLLLMFFAKIGKALFKKEALGGGDIKYMAAMAALYGWGAIVVLAAGSLLGAVAGTVASLQRKKSLSGTAVRFAPWLGAGYLFWCLVATWLIRKGYTVL